MEFLLKHSRRICQDRIALMSLTVEAALATAETRLASQSDSFGLDAQVLLAHILGKDRAWLLAHGDYTLTDSQGVDWQRAVDRVAGGEALPYVIGEWEFYGLKLKITPDVLIPRPETELLVEAALTWLRANPGRRRAIDVGTGSGCIPVALAANLPDLQIIASDISAAALAIARANVERYDLSNRVALKQTSLLEGLPGPFDLICSNLPYIPSERLPVLAVSKREPWLALDGGPDGLMLIRPFLHQAAAALASDGLLLAEIDASLAAAVSDLAKGHWPHAKIEVRNDLINLPRLLVVQS
jgi:release factor glutamine methyltransferase